MKINLLKGRMAERGIFAANISAQLGRERTYACKKVKEPWRFQLSEVYIICDILEIPYEEIPKYFPRELQDIGK